jgi:hypothetical protein
MEDQPDCRSSVRVALTGAQKLGGQFLGDGRPYSRTLSTATVSTGEKASDDGDIWKRQSGGCGCQQNDAGETHFEGSKDKA